MGKNTNSKADQLRAALKAAGFNGRQVTVRYPHSSLVVTVRDASIRLSAVSAIANVFERVSRDSATGEILCGGNTFVDVEYAGEVMEPMARIVAAQLGAAPENQTVTIAGRQVSKMRPGHGRWDWTVNSFDDLEPRIGCHVNGPNADEMMFAARQLVVQAIEHGFSIEPAAVEPSHLETDIAPATDLPRQAVARGPRSAQGRRIPLGAISGMLASLPQRASARDRQARGRTLDPRNQGRS